MKSPNDILAYKVADAIPSDSIARAIAYAIEQPADVEIDEVVIRPTAQDFRGVEF
jgi:NADP-dependent 3-hydroxy acid dehydrogenase YdfG